MLSRSYEAINVIKCIFQSFLMVLKVTIIDFVSDPFIVPLAKNIACRTIFGICIILYQKNKELQFLVHIIPPAHKQNCADPR